MTPSRVAWEFEQGIQAVNFMDMPESVVVMLIIMILAFGGAWFIYGIYRIIKFFFEFER